MISRFIKNQSDPNCNNNNNNIKVGEEIVYRKIEFFSRKKIEAKKNWAAFTWIKPTNHAGSCGKYVRKFERKPKKEKLGSPDTKGTSIIRNGVRGLRVSSSNKMYLPIHPDNRKSNNRNSIANNLTSYLRSRVYFCSQDLLK